MITVRVRDREANALPRWPITAGSVGLPCAFSFDEAWEGLSKIATFKGSGTAVDVALLTEECAVPAEVLATAGGDLIIGVYGANGAGTTVIPTVWANAGYIYEGSEPSEVDPADPMPSWVAQVQAAAEDAVDTADAVAAAAARGDFDGHDGQDGQDGVSPTLSVSTITSGHRISITDVNGTTTVDVMDGQDGQDGTDGVSPEVTIAAITGGHSVTITDEDHPTGQTFDVMDGEDGGVTSVNGETGDVTVTVPTKVSDLTNDVGYGTYSKPSGGIPKADMASAVQTSLGKADTAYQKPSGGIPGSDIASGVIPTVPTTVSSFTNDAGYLTLADLPVYNGSVS